MNDLWRLVNRLKVTPREKDVRGVRPTSLFPDKSSVVWVILLLLGFLSLVVFPAAAMLYWARHAP
jgi:hypothetical protein